MKGLYYLVQYDDGTWGMRFRYIFRYEVYCEGGYSYIHDERTTWQDALILADRDINTEDIPKHFKKTFSLKALGVEIPTGIKSLSIEPLDVYERLLSKREYLKEPSYPTISIGDLCKGILFATASTEKPLKELAENLGQCPQKVLDFICKQRTTEPYFAVDAIEGFSCSAHGATPKDFWAEHY